VGVHNHVRSKVTSPNQSGRMPCDARGVACRIGNTPAKGGRLVDGDGRDDLPREGADEDEPTTPAAG